MIFIQHDVPSGVDAGGEEVGGGLRCSGVWAFGLKGPEAAYLLHCDVHSYAIRGVR